MRKFTIGLVIGCLSIALRTYGQTGSSASAHAAIPLTNLKTPNSPCFQLLDIAPASIERPADPKEFGFSALQLGGSGSALPKNFAIEVAPYWYFRPSHETVYTYLNLPDGTQKNQASGILRKMGISVASSYSDSSNGCLYKNTNYISVGMHTNLLTIRRAADTDSILLYIKIISARLHAINHGNSPIDSIPKLLAKDTAYVNASKNLQNFIDSVSAPAFQLDFATAYSEAFRGNAYSGSRFNRTAAWVTGTYSVPLSKTHKDNLSLLGLVKLMRDNLLVDTADARFQQKAAFDFGGKLSYSNKNVSFGIEFIERRYHSNASFNSHRCVGLLQYKVNQSIYLTGSFGRNFGTATTNLFTMLGVNFGFGNKSVSLPD